ncbi:MAG: MFS transporter [Actinomycetota bacterium]
MSKPQATGPERPALVLVTLIAVAGVANINLAVANVALPTIGNAFDASQTQLNLVAVGFSLGLAASVLYLGALGDRYGRKMMLLLGMGISIPACLLAAFAPRIEILMFARLLGGLAAGMAFPTTLALITALWSGPARTRAIALWSAIGGALTALGPLIAGWLLLHFWWGSVFLAALPLAVIALVVAARVVPNHVNESSGTVDHLGGILSIFLVASTVLAINLLPVPERRTAVVVLVIIAVVTGIAFLSRQRQQRRVGDPLYDLVVAARPTFWVAGCAGIIVFGTLMGGMFIGQQFIQNVLGYSTLVAGTAILPAALCMVLVAGRSAKLVESRGSRFTLLLGFSFCLLAFLVMLLLWDRGTSYLEIALAYVLIGTGVGFAGTPASHSLTSSVPVARAGMASGTADLQRDLGGAIMQSLMGAVLTAGYVATMAAAIAGSSAVAEVTSTTRDSLVMSFAGAEAIAAQHPAYASQIEAAAKASFLAGDKWAYLAGIVTIVLGAALVFFRFPKRDEERRLLAEYGATDAEGG